MTPWTRPGWFFAPRFVVAAIFRFILFFQYGVAETPKRGLGLIIDGLVRIRSHNYDPEAAAVWENAEVFDPKCERMFRYLQARCTCSLLVVASLPLQQVANCC